LLLFIIYGDHIYGIDSNIKTVRNIFLPETIAETLARVDQLNADSNPVWGKMNAAQMLAHCAVAYEMVYTQAQST
jgi:hypothetical protein